MTEERLDNFLRWYWLITFIAIWPVWIAFGFEAATIVTICNWGVGNWFVGGMLGKWTRKKFDEWKARR